MRVCIDSIGISRLKGTGLTIFTFEFLKNLLYMYPHPQYDLLYDELKPEFDMGKNNKAEFLDLNINRRDNYYENIENYIVNNKVDIYHSPNNGFSIPKNKKCYYITTVLNLLPVVNRNYVDDKYFEKFSKVFPDAIKNSDKIIVLSKFLAEQLRNYFDVPDKKIFVNYPGCSKIFTPKNIEGCDTILSSKYSIKGDYILYAGSIHRRKNLEKLIRAFKYVNSIYKNLKLILVGNIEGKRKEYYEKLKLLVKDLNLDESIIFTGTVNYNDMPYFYSKAKCVINLSKYEGFPLSSIEAMACNTPVVWHNENFFREVLGDSGLMVDANNNEMLVDTMLGIISTDSLKEDIIRKQRETVSKYKWENNIINTVRIYESFL